MSHILIIDDDDALRIVLKASLEQMGHTVVESTDGRNGVECYKDDALEQVRSHRVHVVLTDLIMPDKEGIETILDLRKINPDVKIIAMSGGGRVGPGDYLLIARQVGAKRTLTKPFPLDDLKKAIEELTATAGGAD